jgi:hypothetical protein
MSTFTYLKRLFITLFAAMGLALGGIAMAFDEDDHEDPGQPQPVMEQPDLGADPGHPEDDEDDGGW